MSRAARAGTLHQACVLLSGGMDYGGDGGE